MTQEEKAKAYDEAIERSKNYYSTTDSASDIKLIGLIFPELKESEDWIPKEIIKYLKEKGDFRSCWIAWLEKQGEQKPAFEMKTPEGSLGIDSDTYNKIVDECVYGEQKPAWSEEDKDFMYDTLSNLTELKDRYGEGYGNVGKCIDWLKSLKEKYTWKPSDEQMIAINTAINILGKRTLNGKQLIELQEQLKKLKS